MLNSFLTVSIYSSGPYLTHVHAHARTHTCVYIHTPHTISLHRFQGPVVEFHKLGTKCTPWPLTMRDHRSNKTPSMQPGPLSPMPLQCLLLENCFHFPSTLAVPSPQGQAFSQVLGWRAPATRIQYRFLTYQMAPLTSP